MMFYSFRQTKAKITKIDLIRAVYAATPRDYIPILTGHLSIRWDDLELGHLEEVMGNLWKHSGGKPFHLAVETKLVKSATHKSMFL